jgi:hypothetical protein
MEPTPAPLTNQERIEDTLYILSATANRNYNLLSNCLRVYDASKGEPTEPQMALIRGVWMLGIIQFSAFLDEWNQQFLKLKEAGIEVERVEKVERIAKPALDTIALYPSIKAMRDTVLAHNSRTRITRGSPYVNSFRGGLISTFVTPANMSEFMLLATACLEAAQVAKEEFSEFYIEPDDFVAQYTQPNTVQARDNQECFALHESMLEQIAALKQAENG